MIKFDSVPGQTLVHIMESFFENVLNFFAFAFSENFASALVDLANCRGCHLVF